MSENTEAMKNIAKRVFDIEIASLQKVAAAIGDEFDRVVKTILAVKGKVIVTGIGKSGLIGKKIAATLASTGTPSFFLHPGEAFHGDLGMVGTDDIVILMRKNVCCTLPQWGANQTRTRTIRTCIRSI